MSAEKNIGRIVKAEVKTPLDIETYKMGVEIVTGDLKGARIYVSYRAPSFVYYRNVPILVRLDRARKETLHISNIDDSFSTDIPYTGYLLSLDIPEGFVSASSADVILYGKWTKEMIRSGKLPTHADITSVFYVGIERRILHYAKTEDGVRPCNAKKSRPTREINKEDFVPMDIGVALCEYLKHIREKSKPGAPRIVTFDEDINFEELIQPEFMKAIKKRLASYYIEMQPQI